MAKLAGKVAVVTGASKGIGAAIARKFGAEGAKIVVNYATDKAGAEAVVKDVEAGGSKALAVKANVSNVHDVEKLFAETKKAFGKVDILVRITQAYMSFVHWKKWMSSISASILTSMFWDCC